MASVTNQHEMFPSKVTLVEDDSLDYLGKEATELHRQAAFLSGMHFQIGSRFVYKIRACRRYSWMKLQCQRPAVIWQRFTGKSGVVST